MWKYPGLGLPLRHWPPVRARPDDRPPQCPIAAHPRVKGSQSEMLPVREVAMMGIMDTFTDKRDWHKKIFNESITEKWREEAMAIPDEDLMEAAAAPSSDWHKASLVDIDAEAGLAKVATRVEGIMSMAAFDYCIQELQNKARYFEQSGLIPTLDASAAAIKSDAFNSDELHGALGHAFRRLQYDQGNEPNRHPGSRDMVQDLVHPSMYPLIYGQSRAFNEEVVGVARAISQWAAKGNVVRKASPPAPRWALPDRLLHGSEIPESYWSDTYQWLPSNIGFCADGSTRFKSYINNLHPIKYPEIYGTVEKLIDKALVAWDNCPMEEHCRRRCRPGRRHSRFSTPHNAQYVLLAPTPAYDPLNYQEETAPNWDLSDPQEARNVEIELSQDGRFRGMGDQLERKWRILRTPVLREPKPFEEVNYDPSGVKDIFDEYRPGYQVNSASSNSVPYMRPLREVYHARGRQIIVKMASIELTPEKPEFPAGGWHTEGLLNERISATALYYLDSENITESSLSFRMHTSSKPRILRHARGLRQNGSHWLECCYGTNFSEAGSRLQNYGAVKTPEGRFLAFPNTFHNRVSSFRLTDPTKPGHQRFITLWLVDPHRRIISTANVPPQQQDWWTESVFGQSEDSQASSASQVPMPIVQLLRERGVALPDNGSRATLPPELLDMVREGFDLSTLSLEQAKEGRLKLTEERVACRELALQTWHEATYVNQRRHYS